MLSGTTRATLFALSALAVTGVAVGITTSAAHAQTFSVGYQFLDAVRDRDGTKVTELLGEPGTTVINTREPSTGRTALHIVVERRDLTWLRFLLARGADESIADRDGLSPLMQAAQIGFTEAARALIDSGARVNQDNRRGETALHIAVQRRDIPLVRMLVAAGANADTQDSVAGMSPRDYAIRDNRGEAMINALNAPQAATPSALVLTPPTRPIGPGLPAIPPATTAPPATPTPN